MTRANLQWCASVRNHSARPARGGEAVSDALKPCPFCGSAPRHLEHKAGFHTEPVICDQCCFYLSPEEWNTRASDARLAAADARAERLAMALIPLANAHSPAERELLTDDDSEQAQRALYGAALAEGGGEKS